VSRALAAGERVVTLDVLSYAGHLANLGEAIDHPNFRFVEGSILDRALLDSLLQDHRPRAVVHFAAESHVDRSIDGPDAFVETNVLGTYVLLQATRNYADGLSAEGLIRFLHVSTDEVFGSITEGEFTEDSPYRPNSPYAASKAASDHFVRAWAKTFNLPTIVTHCSNNYGPFQLPEKLIPLMIQRAKAGEQMPVYGDGTNVRDWLHVYDHCDALLTLLDRGQPGEAYNVGGGHELSNLDVVREICTALDSLAPRADGSKYDSLIEFVVDRPGHDWRYAVDPTKLMKAVGWAPAISFAAGLRQTVEWYLSADRWLEEVAADEQSHKRRGVRSPRRNSGFSSR
jgi:dTDP-glucose 4,6-dehydratase